MNGKLLNKLLNLGAKHSLYREDGGWYHHLKLFPGVLFDRNGYVLFKSYEEYLNHPNLRHRKDLNVIPGISTLPEYILFNDEQKRKFTFDKKEIDEESIRVLREVNMILRNNTLIRKIKYKYKDTCQVCGIRLGIRKNVYYSEVHHIKPLGNPHKGPDKTANMICVCPNCHIQLDMGSIPINIKTFKILKHDIGNEYISYYNNTILVK